MSDVLCTNGAAKKGLKRPTDYDYAHASCISAPARPLNETGPSHSQRAIERRGGEERTDGRGRTLLVLPADVEPIILRRQSRVGCGGRVAHTR